ncbi:SGF29 tudor-like domain-containing protein [Gaertneriomyces semiglobifer]|nr:SGF29 tudor-like domain-containing protein [Gaertneriomyces semiglobifer]
MADTAKLRKSRSASADLGANEELAVWSSLCDGLCQFKRQIDVAEKHIVKANKVHAKLQNRAVTENKGISSGTKDKLINLYEQCCSGIDSEKDAVGSVLETLGILIGLRAATESGADKPIDRRKKRKLDEKPKPAFTPIKKAKGVEETPPEKVIANGHKVCVPMEPPAGQSSSSQEWMLGVVVNWLPDKGKYAVEDAEADEVTGQRKQFLYPSSTVIPILSLREAARRVPFPKDHEVLALYPNTSCFYRARVVVSPPKPGSDYIVRFEDDNEVDRPVNPPLVLDLPKNMKSSR